LNLHDAEIPEYAIPRPLYPPRGDC
jgi:hypothetical protein